MRHLAVVAAVIAVMAISAGSASATSGRSSSRTQHVLEQPGSDPEGNVLNDVDLMVAATGGEGAFEQLPTTTSYVGEPETGASRTVEATRCRSGAAGCP